MKNKILLIIAGLVLLLVIAAVINHYRNVIQELRSDIQRGNENLYEAFIVSDANRLLWLKEKEFSEMKTGRIDSLMKELKVKPREVIRYEEIIITDTIRDTVEVYITENIGGRYPFNYQKNCFDVWGYVDVSDSVAVSLTRLDYQNNLQYLASMKQKKFLFIKIGKPVYTLQVKPVCGDVYTTELNVVR